MSIEGFNGEENYYPPPTSNKHKGDVMERREWTYKYLRGQGYLIGEEDRGCIATAADELIAKSVCDDHNQHAALVEQRDLLVAMLKEARRTIDGDVDYLDLRDEIDHALATVEQPNALQTKSKNED